jgi:hypothetical protein
MGKFLSALQIFVLLVPSAIAQSVPNVQNVDESKVGKYTLPDPLIAANGTRIKNAKQWNRLRRPELIELFETNMFGKSPGRPLNMKIDAPVIDRKALNGKAVRKQVTIYFSGDKNGPKMNLLVYLPVNVPKAPVFLGLNFRGNHTVHADPGIRLAEVWSQTGPQKSLEKKTAGEDTRGSAASQWQVEKVLSRGYGLATVYAGDVEPDFKGALDHSVRALYLKGGAPEPGPDEWGALAAWGWALSRALDYFESDPEVDAKRVAIIGHSRMGKAALWAGARDTRFAMVVSNDSGEGGAALSKRNFGETVQHLNEAFPHWYCANYKKFSNHEADLPMDAHELIALIAPRPVYIATADADIGADTLGQFLAAVNAGPVYALLGKQGLGTDKLPPVHQPIMHDIGFHVRTGKHDMTEYDWEQYLTFADREMK